MPQQPPPFGQQPPAFGFAPPFGQPGPGAPFMVRMGGGGGASSRFGYFGLVWSSCCDSPPSSFSPSALRLFHLLLTFAPSFFFCVSCSSRPSLFLRGIVFPILRVLHFHCFLLSRDSSSSSPSSSSSSSSPPPSSSSSSSSSSRGTAPRDRDRLAPWGTT